MAVKKKAEPGTKEESKQILNMMANEDFKTDLTSLLKVRYPLFYVVTNEEHRFLKFMEHYANVKGYEVLVWDCFQGLVELNSREKVGGSDDEIKDPMRILEHIKDEGKNYINNREAVGQKKESGTKGIIYILLDFHHFIHDDEPEVERRLKAITSLDGIVSTILTGPTYKTTPVLENLTPRIEFPLSNKEEIKEGLWKVVNSISSKIPAIQKDTKKYEEALVNAVTGLSYNEAQTALAKSLVRHRGWNIKTILDEKKQIISKTGILEFCNPVPMEEVGGLGKLVDWIKLRKACFSSAAEKYGLQKPRGVLAIGMPGCGKSLICKAISGTWGMPLLRLDFGKLFDSLVGQSEARARSALRLAESIAPCVSYDTKIKIENKEEEIGKIYDSIDDIYKEELDKYTIIAKLEKPVMVQSFDVDTELFVSSKLNAIIKREVKNKKVYKITLADGTTIKVSEDHKLLVYENKNKIWKKMKDIREKDEIITM